MAITCEDKAFGIAIDGDNITKKYIIKGTNSEAEAKAKLDEVAGDDGLVTNGKAVSSTRVNQITDGYWEGEAEFTEASSVEHPREIGTCEISFAIGQQTIHISECISVSDSDGDEDIPIGKSIGVQEDGVEGVDIDVPAVVVNVRRVYSLASAPSYNTLYNCAQKTNSTNLTLTDSRTNRSFMMAAGEARLTNITDNYYQTSTKQDAMEINYEFHVAPNESDISIGGFTVNKKGWEYLWVRYQKKEIDSPKMVLLQPTFAAVCKVYHDVDFGVLNI